MKDAEKKDQILAALNERIGAGHEGADVQGLKTLTAQIFRYTAVDAFDRHDADELYASIASLWELLAERPPGQPQLRLYTPIQIRPDRPARHSTIEVATDDMPFLVDSIRLALQRHGLAVHMLAHSVFRTTRDATGKLTRFSADGGDGTQEAVVYVEVDRRTDAGVLDQLREDLRKTFDDVRAAVTGWPKMRAKVREILGELNVNPPPVVVHEVAEAKAFLEWIEDHHFTFLGYRQYELGQEDGEDVLRMVPGSALGTAPTADTAVPSQTFAALPAEQRARFREPHALILTKANVRARVHRSVYMDYIGVKRFDAAGNVVGEHRFLGLYTSAAYNRSPRDIPILRRKVEAVLARAAFPRYSHSGKALLNILDTYPRDELFQIEAQELYANAMRILTMEDRKQASVLVRREIFGRFASCLVFIPRERYDTKVRERVQNLLLETFRGESVDYTVYVSESMLARIFFIIHTPPGGPVDYDADALQARLTEITRTWEDELGETLRGVYGEEVGDRLGQRYAGAFPAGYRDDFDARAATRDIEDIEELASAPPPVLALYIPRRARAGEFRCKIFATGAVLVLSDILPLFENLGVRVLSERPYEIRPRDTEGLSIYDLALQFDGMDAKMLEAVREPLIDTLAATWRNEAENDGFNRLVLRARLGVREVVILRAYAKYLRQIGIPFGQAYQEDVLARHPEIVRALIDLYHARFDYPPAEGSAAEASRLAASLQTALDAVESLDADRILRAFYNTMQATMRTNIGVDVIPSKPPPSFVFKIDPKQLPECPQPRPAHEIFVYSPRVEGVHLRGGAVARGGIRWSDRREDFRTEVLGLMKAQMVKNAIIVPVGAKGGFVVKQPPAGADRSALMQEVTGCYEIFIRGLLAVTDNIREGLTLRPEAVRCYDGDDPYLVVAADKGTATFSDHANAIAQDRSFWLGDAFASGGSSGYDHKKMGITARGAWESVKRHFHELGLDAQSKPFTAVAIGDMSGDVFGNGMLCSHAIKLVGAFDHRHIFIDPTPDPEASFRERERLFRLPRSSWADYDSKLISEGGGVYPRHLKAIKLSPQARQVLGVHAQSLAPDAVIRALLKAPVELLWNGGIGTYVKARAETHVDVGDRGNDGVRVDACELRCRVVAEGGNLGVTQLGRIEYAAGGGRINTDFIDNAGGVACSDYEVNIKILLNELITRGALDAQARDALLARMTEEVAALVLSENRWQALALSLMEARGEELHDELARFMAQLERNGQLDRTLERLPSEEALAQRRAAKLALTRPELAVLMAYAKNVLSEELAAARLSEVPALGPILLRYFPVSLRDRAADAVVNHPLRHELIATYLSNRMVNRLGPSFAAAVQEELGVSSVAIAKAYLAAWQIFGLPDTMSELDKLQWSVSAETLRRALLAITELTQRAVLWLLRNLSGEIEIMATVARFKPGVEHFERQFAAVASPEQVVEYDRRAEELVAGGLTAALARRLVRLPMFYAALDVAEITRATAVNVEQAAAVYFAVERALDLAWLHARIAALPSSDRWHLRAREALNDDLYIQQRQLATELIRAADGATEVGALMERWLGASNGGVDRYRQMTADLKKLANVDLSMLTVAVKNLNTLRRDYAAMLH